MSFSQASGTDLTKVTVRVDGGDNVTLTNNGVSEATLKDLVADQSVILIIDGALTSLTVNTKVVGAVSLSNVPLLTSLTFKGGMIKMVRINWRH